MLAMTDATKVLQNFTQQLKSLQDDVSSLKQRQSKEISEVGRDATVLEAGVGRDATVLEAEPSLIVLGEGDDLALGVEHILPVSPVLGVEI